MEVWLEQALGQLSGSWVYRALVLTVPVAITVAAIAGWRQRVEGAAALALQGAAFCLWLALPLSFAYVQLQQTSLIFSILCWLWLVLGWLRHVLGEWPAPIWGHWIVGTLLLFLPIATALVLLLA
jgi:hypothetical protein